MVSKFICCFRILLVSDCSVFVRIKKKRENLYYYSFSIRGSGMPIAVERATQKPHADM